MLRVLAVSALLTGLVPGVARGTPWHRPVSGRIVGAFSFSPGAPYAAGRHRGIVLAAAPGTPVASACAGTVAFAGSVGRAGPTLSVRCGKLRATYQGLSEITVGAGQTVARGAPVGRVAEDGLRLGARTAGRSYVDPAALFAAAPPGLGPAPAGIRRNRPRRPPRPAAAPARPAPAAPAPQPARTPAPVWIALAVVLAALPTGGLLRRTGRRRAVAAARAPSPSAR